MKTQLDHYIFHEAFSDITIQINLSLSAIPINRLWAPGTRILHVLDFIFLMAHNTALCTQYIYLFTTELSSLSYSQDTKIQRP